MAQSIHIQLARTLDEFTAAHRLLHESRKAAGLLPAQPESQMWLLKQHALPTSNLIVALDDKQKVIGAISIIGENPFHLPLEDQLPLERFRAELGSRIAELSFPAMQGRVASQDLWLALHHFALQFGANYCNYDTFLVESPKAWRENYQTQLGFRPLLDGRALCLDLHEHSECRSLLPLDYPAQFHLPERKFFLVAQQTMPASAFDHLFNEKSSLFASLSDLELRVLKNIYDFGDYAKALPQRSLAMPVRATSKHRRFQMNCEGFLGLPGGEKTNVQLLDVSREGLKVRAEERLKLGSAYPLTLLIGVHKKTEVIATVVWTDELAQISGLLLQSADRQWDELLKYLEKGDVQTVA